MSPKNLSLPQLVYLNKTILLCLVIDFKMRKFSRFFICLRSLGKKEKAKEHSIKGFPKSVVLCSQQFCGLPEMVKNPFWYKKYKDIN